MSYGSVGKSLWTTPSTTAQPGPVSNARTPASDAVPRGVTTVTLPMPPRFCSARNPVAVEKSSASAIGTSGAPWPPAATSATRKSEITSTPVRSAMTAGSPNCHVEWPGSCQTVWPCEQTARTSARGTPASAMTVTAASASQSPRSKSSRQYSAGVAPASAVASRRRRVSS
jgi:hypothetical protein